MLKEGSIMGARSVFTREFKERAVELALNTNRKRSEIAQKLGIDHNMLARWKREMKQNETGSMKAFTGRGNARDEQMARLRKEIAGLRETNDILKKAFVHLHGRESPVAAYPFMRRYQGRYPVTKTAGELGAGRSGWYARLVRKPGRHEQTDQALVRLISWISEAHRGRYGSPRVWQTLLQEFRVRVSRKRVERLMREQGLKARKKKRGG
jgi:transposase